MDLLKGQLDLIPLPSAKDKQTVIPVVSFQFEGGATATLTMVAFSQRCQRDIKVYGIKGEITYNDALSRTVQVFDFVTQRTVEEELTSLAIPGVVSGHDGADYNLMYTFVSALRDKKTDLIETGPDDTLSSHLLVFAAEKARKENCVVSINEDGSF